MIDSNDTEPAAESGVDSSVLLGCDRIAEWCCSIRIAKLRELGLKHLKETTAETAALEIDRRDYILGLHWCPEHYGHDMQFGNWHCTVTRRRAPMRGVVVAQGHGETIRGSMVMALTEIEWAESKHPNSN